MLISDKISSYEPMIYSCINKLNILYDKDEYMQIGRLAVYEGLKKFDSSKAKCSESQFLYTMIRQRLIDEIRKTSRYQERNTLVDDDGLAGCFVKDEYYINNDIDKVLNTREYNWFILVSDGYSLKEIARQLDVSLSTAKNIRKSARNKIRYLYYD